MSSKFSGIIEIKKKIIQKIKKAKQENSMAKKMGKFCFI